MAVEEISWNLDDPYYLEHHGVKGMKWGIRRYQNKDGSLTKEGMRKYGNRYKAQKEFDKRKEAYRKAYAKDPYSKDTYDKYDKLKNSNINKRNAAVLDIVNNQKNKSKSQIKYEEEYRKKGYSEDAAKVAAYRKDRAKKVLAVSAGIAVAGIASYAGYKYWKQNADHMIKNDLIRFSPNDSSQLHDVFYATPHKRDAKKYVGFYGGGQMGGAEGRIKGFQKTIKTDGGIKVAGDKSARKVFGSLMTDDSGFKKDVTDSIRKEGDRLGDVPNFMLNKQTRVYKKAAEDLRKGKTDTKAIYEAFNIGLADRNRSANKSFYKTLKDKGFDAVIDVNDQRKSGYNAKLPVVVFNSAKAQVNDVRNVPTSEMKKELNNQVMKMSAKITAKQLGIYGGAAVAGIGSKAAYDTVTNNKKVAEYRKEHPKTKLTDLEIMDLVNR